MDATKFGTFDFVEVVDEGGPDRKYTVKFREAAVRQVLDGGRGVARVARSLVMSDKTLANWVLKARRGQPLVKVALGQPVSDVQAELARLRQENARLKLEKEILYKKPLSRFAAAHMDRNKRCLRWDSAWTEAACFLEAFDPVRERGPVVNCEARSLGLRSGVKSGVMASASRAVLFFSKRRGHLLE